MDKVIEVAAGQWKFKGYTVVLGATHETAAAHGGRPLYVLRSDGTCVDRVGSLAQARRVILGDIEMLEQFAQIRARVLGGK